MKRAYQAEQAGDEMLTGCFLLLFIMLFIWMCSDKEQKTEVKNTREKYMIERVYYDENMEKHTILAENEEDVLRQIEAIRAKFRLNTKANDELIKKHTIADKEEEINTKVDVFNDNAVEQWADELISKDDLSYMTLGHKRQYKYFLMRHKKEANYSDHLCAILALIDVHNMDCLIDEPGGGPQD